MAYALTGAAVGGATLGVGLKPIAIEKSGTNAQKLCAAHTSVG